MQDEHYDFVIPVDKLSQPAIQRFLELLRSDTARAGLTRIGFQVPPDIGTVYSSPKGEPRMFSFEEARQRVLERVEPLAEREQLAVKSALGRILADDVRAPFDIPPLPNSARDGYALRAADLVSTGSVHLRVVAEVPAGQYCDTEIKTGEAARIFTGAPLPPGADTVVMQEHVQRHDDVR